jgi:hypothetical protein
MSSQHESGPAWQPRAGGRCVCGATVDPAVARVVGIGGVVPACPRCVVDVQGRAQYRTVTQAVGAYLRGNAQRHADVSVDARLHPEVDG